MWLALTGLLSGCGAPSSYPCEHTALLLAERDERCGGGLTALDYEHALGCEVAVPRSFSQLEMACWPALETADCGVVGRLPEACHDQF